MAELRMTQQRLDLLRAIDTGAVTQQYPIMPEPAYTLLDRHVADGGGVNTLGRYVTVTARVEELRRAGLCTLGGRLDSHYKAPRRWELTDAGRAVVAGHG